MAEALTLLVLFVAKVFDNMLGTAKIILIQRNKSILAGAALALSNFIYLNITKSVVSSGNSFALVVVAIASGVGCCMAISISNRFSKEKTYVNVLMSDDIDEMKSLRDFLAGHHITNVAAKSYTKDWDHQTITITAYADTKEQSQLIDAYIRNRTNAKFKRVTQKG